MPALVDGARHPLHPVALRVARRDAYVCCVATSREGMDGHVHPPLSEVKTDRSSNLAAHLFLLLCVPLGPALQWRRHLMEGRLCLNLGGDAADEGSKLRLDLVEDFLDAGGRHFGVKHVNRSVVDGHVGLGGAADLPLHLKNLCQRRGKRPPVALSARVGPCAVCAALELRLARGKGAAHARCLVKALRGDAEVCRVEGGEGRRVRLELLQELADGRVRLGLVNDGSKGSLLLRPCFLSALRHHRLLVPPEKPPNALQVRRPPEPGDEVGVGIRDLSRGKRCGHLGPRVCRHASETALDEGSGVAEGVDAGRAE
mmetsp:Transcript_36660/g.92174  ORF Transcript_36660/g.92174 Transcript_36660/m.92174 type:complete len:314 (+) Transcript_36660:839-1780(+)